MKKEFLNNLSKSILLSLVIGQMQKVEVFFVIQVYSTFSNTNHWQPQW